MNTATQSEPQVEITRVFDAPRELVFRAWSDREHLLNWYAPNGCEIQIATLEFRPGGRFHTCIRNPAFGECWVVGVYLEIIAPERIVYTMASADAAGNLVEPADVGHDNAWPRETTVTVTLTESEGKTKLTLHQTVSEALAKRTGAHPSWIQMLDRLEAELAKQGS